MRRYPKEDQRALATWSADCAERVLPLFEQAHPDDRRPRQAIDACREWVRTGVFAMSTIRTASLNAHAAARAAKPTNEAACLAARAAGQAVATAHVPQHAFGGSYYALKALAAAAADRADAETTARAEREWQASQLPADLRQEFLERIVVEVRRNGVVVTLRKDGDF
ncbi:hypothetical protein BLA60_11205 [Actinophytocola xinjiangensis]|uniref:Imm-5-like domain-containing protein n=1 Tax=Actinophytocola xinjiangensis TaxID=485602 RepID=A0A7Z0WPA4_9PSEU|nr:hypothetical protein [Actinophytocola xinjiangensis]OLF11526.1 hypothetical protein BLA60_11205 [Actinophytocola xinjiangensis]